MTIKIHFDRSYSKNCWEIFAYKKGDGFRIPFSIQIIEHKLLNDNEAMQPTCELEKELFGDLITALKEAMMAGGMLENSSACEAELKATKYHLEDMRILGLMK